VDIPGFSATREVTEHEDGGAVVTVTPPAFTKQPKTHVVLDPDQYRRFKLWYEGKGKIQDLLPDLSAGEREKLMTGLTDLKSLFGGDDDE
jgi:hypothetical protein